MRLAAEPDMTVVGEAADGAAALDLVEEVRPEVVLMDVAMPILDGIQATSLLRQLHPEVAVIVLTMYEDAATRTRAAHAGAAGFVAKSAPIECLLDAIRDTAWRIRRVKMER